MEYYIYITNKCNMNCSYCSVMMEEHKSNIPAEIKYSLNDLRKFVDKTQSSCPSDENAVIYFFGGEPTLNYEKIYEIMNKFQGVSEYNVTYVLHTNGLLLDEIPEKIISKINVIFLSLNYERMFDNGLITPYFSKIVNTINKCNCVIAEDGTVCSNYKYTSPRKKWNKKLIKAWLQLIDETITGSSTLLQLDLLPFTEKTIEEAQRVVVHALVYNFGSMDSIIAATAKESIDKEESIIVITSDKGLKACLKQCNIPSWDLLAQVN